MFIYREDRHCRILIRTVTFIIIAAFLCENAVWASPELLQPNSVFQKESKNNRGALVQMKGACRYVKECRKLSEDDDNPKALQELKGKNKEAEGRDIGGNQVEHGTKINPRLASWIRDNRVVDYYYEEGRWVPHRVKYIEDIASGEIGIGSSEYYDEQGNPIDKGDQIVDGKQLSDEEQRRLNETLQGCGYSDELIRRLRLRVVLGETMVAWMEDLEHSFLVHVGERSAIIWFGEGLFRNLLMKDIDLLRKEVFEYEKENLTGNHNVDEGDKHNYLADKVHRRCILIEKGKMLRKKREQLEMRQKDMVEALPERLKVGPIQLSKYERAENKFNDDLLIAVNAIWEKNIGAVLEKKREQLGMNHKDIMALLPEGLRVSVAQLREIELGKDMPGDGLAEAIHEIWRKNIRGALRKKREQLGFSQMKIAKELPQGLRISQSHLNNIEMGGCMPRDELIQAISNMWTKNIGKVLRKKRKQLCMGQADMAERLKIRKKRLGELEQGENMPSDELIETIYKLWEKNIGKVISKRREQLGLSQSGMVKMLPRRLRVRYEQLSKIERSVCIPNNELVEAIIIIWKDKIGDVRTRRKQLGMSMKDMAEALKGKLEINQSQLSKIESEECMPSNELLDAVYDVWEKNIGRALRKKREQLGLTRGKMVSLLPVRLGINAARFSKIEQGRAMPDDKLIETIYILWKRNIGEALRRKRKQLDMRLRDMAAELPEDLKVSRGYLTEIELSSCMPSGELIEAVGRIWKARIGKVLRKKRKQLGMTMIDMMEALPRRLRISRQYLTDIEHGRKIPSCGLVKAIEVIWENNIGRVLKKKRKQLGMSPEDMVSVLQGKLEVDSALIFDIESGARMTGDELIERIHNLWRENIGKILRRKREALGISQKDMAFEISDGIEVTSGEISRIERGKRMPSDEIVESIGDYYKNEIRLMGGIRDDAYLGGLEDENDRDIGGTRAKHREEINPELAGWIRNNRVVDYYYEGGRWVPYRVKYVEGIDPENEDYYDEQGNPIDKGEQIADSKQLSDEEQRRLNEALQLCGYDELGKPVRFRVVLGETMVAWMEDLEHSSFVHVGKRSATVWFGEGLFRDLLSRDEDTLSIAIFRHEKEHLIGNHSVDEEDGYQHLVEEVHRRRIQIECVIERNPELDLPRSNDEQICAVKERVKDEIFGEYELIKESEATLQRDGLDYEVYRVSVYTIKNIAGSRPQLIRGETLEILGTVLRRAGLYRDIYEEAGYAITKIVKNRPDLSGKALQALEACLQQEGLDSYACLCAMNAITNIVDNKPELIRRSTLQVLETTLKRDELYRGTYWKAAYIIGNMALDRPELYVKALKILETCLLHEGLPGCACEAVSFAVRDIVKKRPELIRGSTIRALRITLGRDGLSTNTCGAVAYALKGIAEKKPELSEEVLPGLGDALLCDELVDDDRRDTVCAIRKIAQSRPELAEEALRVLVNVFQRKGFDNDVLITIGSIMPLASDRIDRDYLLSILNMCKLCRIGFHDGGSAVNNFSGLAEGILMGGNAAEIKEDTSFVPEFKQSDIQQLNEQDNIDNFIVDYELAKDIPHAEGGVLGRTLIYRHKQDGTYLGLKLLKKGEDAGALVYESEMLEYINNNYTGLGLRGRYPEPVLIGGNRVIRVKELPEDALSALKARKIKEGESLELDNRGAYYTLMAYRVNNKDYFTYLNNEDIEEEKFEEAVLTNIRDLVSLARAGIIHTALIELFHNVARPDRPDLGRYLWMVDIVGLGNIYITTGTGRLHNWEGAVRYPNLRLSGLADFADTALLDYMVDNPRHPGCVHLLNVEDRIENEELLKKIYLANFLGDYLLSAALILGSRMKRRGEFNWEDPVRLAGFMKRVFNTAYKEFTGRGPGILDESIDWNMLARQMSYFMSSAYVEDFRPELRAEEQEGRLREKKIYAEDTDIGFGDYREESWSDEVGWTGFLRDGRSDNQPALGPVNGPLPLQELVRALYFYTAFMVTDISQKPDASTTQEDNARRFVNTVKGEGVRQKGKRIILALDTDIGNMTQFEINEILKQIRDVCSLLGDIEFVAGSGEELQVLIEGEINRKVERRNIEVVVVTKRDRGNFSDSFHVTRVDDSNLGDPGSYVPILELLTFALTINLREDDEILRKELRGIYNEITGKELTGELIEEIKKGTFAIELPQTERIPLDFYNESTEILRSA